jgi:hypothetical protein
MINQLRNNVNDCTLISAASRAQRQKRQSINQSINHNAGKAFATHGVAMSSGEGLDDLSEDERKKAMTKKPEDINEGGPLVTNELWGLVFFTDAAALGRAHSNLLVRRDAEQSKATDGRLMLGRAAMMKPEQRGKGGALESMSPLHPEPSQKSDCQGASKSRGNLVNLDEIASSNGASALRACKVLVDPLKAPKPWQTRQVQGVTLSQNMARNVIHNAVESQTTKMNEETTRLLHETTKKVVGGV